MSRSEDQYSWLEADEHFVVVPDWIVMNKKLSHGAVRLWSVLGTYADRRTKECWPGRKRLATDLGCSVRMITNYLADLRAAGALEITQRVDMTNVYKLLTSFPQVEKHSSLPREVECPPVGKQVAREGRTIEPEPENLELRLDPETKDLGLERLAQMREERADKPI